MESKYGEGTPKKTFAYKIAILEHTLSSETCILEYIKYAYGTSILEMYLMFSKMPIVEDNLCSRMATT